MLERRATGDYRTLTLSQPEEDFGRGAEESRKPNISQLARPNIS